MRTVVWFSCGAASAVAAKLAVEQRTNVSVVYCDTSKSESTDNPRFMRDVAQWIGQPIEIIGSKKYASVDDVIEQRRYMSGVNGALCTTELKKIPRFAYQWPDDEHVFGYTADESDRMDLFERSNPELRLWWALKDAGLTKGDCYAKVAQAGIELPILYRQGYRNNNCIGCVKATSAEYWNKVRMDYPDVFARRAKQSRELGVRLTRWRGERVFIDELPYIPIQMGILDEDISCGPECSISSMR